MGNSVEVKVELHRSMLPRAHLTQATARVIPGPYERNDTSTSTSDFRHMVQWGVQEASTQKSTMLLMSAHKMRMCCSCHSWALASR